MGLQNFLVRSTTDQNVQCKQFYLFNFEQQPKRNQTRGLYS